MKLLALTMFAWLTLWPSFFVPILQGRLWNLTEYLWLVVGTMALGLAWKAHNLLLERFHDSGVLPSHKPNPLPILFWVASGFLLPFIHIAWRWGSMGIETESSTMLFLNELTALSIEVGPAAGWNNIIIGPYLFFAIYWDFFVAAFANFVILWLLSFAISKSQVGYVTVTGDKEDTEIVISQAILLPISALVLFWFEYSP